MVARTHEGTINLRYLAPPAAVLAMLLGLVVSPIFPLGLIIPGGYLLAIVAGSVLTGGGLPMSARLRLPLVYATMHCSWGWGFLTSPKKLSRPPSLTPRTPRTPPHSGGVLLERRGVRRAPATGRRRVHKSPTPQRTHVVRRRMAPCPPPTLPAWYGG
ncbi:hypothetical protein GCM10020001_060780 [Nonomuraea salmonea]